MTRLADVGVLALFGAAVVALAPVAASSGESVQPDRPAAFQDVPPELFDPAVRWVPGDQRTADLTLHNPTSADRRLSVAVRAPRPGGWVSRGAVTLSARVDGGRWIALDHQVPGALGRGPVLPAGETRQVQVRAQVHPWAGNRTRDERVLQFALSLDPPGLAGSQLRVTQETPDRWPMLLAGVVAGTGAGAAWRGRSKEGRKGESGHAGA